MTATTMRTPAQVVADLEKTDQVIKEAQKRRDLLMSELESMSSFTSDAVFRLKPKDNVSYLPTSPYSEYGAPHKLSRPLAAGEF